MIPIRDTIRSRSFPIVTLLLIVANALVFFFELNLSPAGLEQFVNTLGLVPASLNLANPLTFLPFLTHLFIHGGWVHILSNMWMLFIFGDNVEERMGPVRFLVFYLLGGIAAGALQSFVNLNSTAPAIGASGAIAAVLGAYFLFFPRAQVITLIPIFIFPWFVNIPAMVYLGFWFIMQLFSGSMALVTASGASMGGVAWWAHIGGFLFGMAAALLFGGFRRRKERVFPDEYYPW